MDKWQHLSIVVASSTLLLLGYLVHTTYGQTVEKGIIGQVVSGGGMEFYVHGVKVTEDSGNKIVNVSMVFKNENVMKRAFDPSDVRLVDSQSREYAADKDFLSVFANENIPLIFLLLFLVIQ